MSRAFIGGGLEQQHRPETAWGYPVSPSIFAWDKDPRWLGKHKSSRILRNEDFLYWIGHVFFYSVYYISSRVLVYVCCYRTSFRRSTKLVWPLIPHFKRIPLGNIVRQCRRPCTPLPIMCQVHVAIPWSPRMPRLALLTNMCCSPPQRDPLECFLNPTTQQNYKEPHIICSVVFPPKRILFSVPKRRKTAAWISTNKLFLRMRSISFVPFSVQSLPLCPVTLEERDTNYEMCLRFLLLLLSTTDFIHFQVFFQVLIFVTLCHPQPLGDKAFFGHLPVVDKPCDSFICFNLSQPFFSFFPNSPPPPIPYLFLTPVPQLRLWNSGLRF